MPKAERPRSFVRQGISSLFRPGDLVFGRGEELDKVQAYLELLGHTMVCARDINVPLIDELIAGKLTNDYIYGLDPVMRRHARLLTKNKRYLLGGDGKNPWPDSDRVERSIAIRRACKLIVREAARNHKRSVHFMLSGMSHWRVTRKKRYGKPDDVDVSISGGELRTAFKCQEEAESSPLSTGRPAFFFYDKSNQSVLPPWEPGSKSKRHYEHYRKTRVAKGKAELSSRAGRALDLEMDELSGSKAQPAAKVVTV